MMSLGPPHVILHRMPHSNACMVAIQMACNTTMKLRPNPRFLFYTEQRTRPRLFLKKSKIHLVIPKTFFRPRLSTLPQKPPASGK